VTEELVPRAEPVQVGEVRLVKRVVTEKRTIEVEVRHEEVSVEHHPTDASGSPLVVLEYEQQHAAEVGLDSAPEPDLSGEEDVTRVPVYAEQIVVSRRPYVVEEVWVRKRRVLERRTVTGEVRREDLEVEPVGELVVEQTATGTAVRPRRGGREGRARTT
jgi:stress response protein YsnF